MLHRDREHLPSPASRTVLRKVSDWFLHTELCGSRVGVAWCPLVECVQRLHTGHEYIVMTSRPPPLTSSTLSKPSVSTSRNSISEVKGKGRKTKQKPLQLIFVGRGYSSHRRLCFVVVLACWAALIEHHGTCSLLPRSASPLYAFAAHLTDPWGAARRGGQSKNSFRPVQIKLMLQ